MQTVNLFVSGRYKHVQLDKPADVDYLVLEQVSREVEACELFCTHRTDSSCTKKKLSAGQSVAGKPVIVFWDIAETNLDTYAIVLQEFLTRHRPSSLMISGPV